MNYLLNGLPYFPGTTIFGTGLFANGTNAVPSISFQSDPDTGIYLDASNTLGIATAGVGTLLFSSSAGIGKIKAHGTRVLALEAGTGNTNITLTPSGSGVVQSSGAFQTSDGTAAAPSISFAADAGTGFYRSAANTVSVSVGGARGFDFSGSGFTLRGVPILGTDSIAITAGGSNRNITLTPSGTGTVSVGSIIVGSSFANSQLDLNSSGITLQATSGIDFKTSAGTQAARFFSNGRFALGTITDSGALLQIGTNTTTSAGGMVFGTDSFLYRYTVGALTLAGTTNSATFLLYDIAGGTQNYFAQSGGSLYIGVTGVPAGANDRIIVSASSILLKTTSGTTALTLDSSQRTILAGALRLNNAYVAGAVVGTGYVTIQDSTGTTYRVPVLV